MSEESEPAHPYYTHRPHLIEVLNRFDYSKDVRALEFGTGDGSAVVFQDFALKYPNLSVTAYETEHSWYTSMKEKYETQNYKFNHVEDWSKTLESIDYSVPIDIAFVDSGTWDSRITIIDRIKDYCRYIILHDYNYYNVGYYDQNIEDISKDSFFGRYLDSFDLDGRKDVLPPTLIFKSKKNL